MTAAHRLDPLLRPGSLAVVGASARAGSVGARTLANLRAGGYAGRLYPVNPRHDSLQGLSCYADLAALPEAVDHAVFCVGAERVEAAVDDAIAAGAKAVTIMSALHLHDEAAAATATGTTLRERVAGRLRQAGILVCGANAMGIYNFRDNVWICGFDTRSHTPPGNVALISQSGSGMCGIVDCEARIDFNLAVSTGYECTVGLEDYLDFALQLPETRVVGLFLETCRNPARLRAAFAKANRKHIPIVAIKTGRTRRSAELTVSHSGALAGDDAAYEALFERYGVQRVRDMDELATALILFAQMPAVGPGGLVTLHDSGGERQLLIDLAAEQAVPLAPLTPETLARLGALLDPGLPAVNPLDAWGRGGPDADEIMKTAMAALLSDPNAAVGAVIHDRAPDSGIYPEYIDYLTHARSAAGKPLALVAARQGTGADPLVTRTTKQLGFPVLDGVSGFLAGVRCLFGHRDFHAQPTRVDSHGCDRAVARWHARLSAGRHPDAAAALEMLRDFGVPATRAEIIGEQDQAVARWRRLGLPVALKTAADVAHKTEHGGVYLALDSEAAIRAAWHELAARFAAPVLVAPMAPAGIEMMLGMTLDPDFGPLVLLGFGGIHAETLHDFCCALPPFDAAAARRLLDRLRLRPLLDGARGRPPCDVEAFCAAAARFSELASGLGGTVNAIDVNPLIVHPGGCIAVDALIAPAADRAAGLAGAGAPAPLTGAAFEGNPWGASTNSDCEATRES